MSVIERFSIMPSWKDDEQPGSNRNDRLIGRQSTRKHFDADGRGPFFDRLVGKRVSLFM